jgi:hypothetical protein
VRGRHGRAAKTRIGTVRGKIAGTSACARCCDIGFDPPAAIGCHRAATAKARDGIGACYQRACAVSCRVKSRRILHRGTIRSGVLCGGYHHDTSRSLCLHSSLQGVKRTTFRRRALPGVVSNIRGLGRIGIAAADPGRRKEPLHALDVPGWCACIGVHVTATDPLGSRRHPDLVAQAIVTDQGAGSMGAMAKIIARER